MSAFEEEVRNKLHRIEMKLDAFGASDKLKAEHNKILLPPKFAIETKIINEEAFRKFLGTSKPEVLPDVALRFASWDYEWSCNGFNVCNTTYSGSVFVVRTDTGVTLTWNLIESATKLDTGLPYWSTSPNYQFAQNSTQVGFGFGNGDGRTCNVSTCVNCYSDAGAISFRWDANAC